MSINKKTAMNLLGAILLTTTCALPLEGQATNQGPRPSAGFSPDDIGIMAQAIGGFIRRAQEGQVICLSIFAEDWSLEPAPEALVEESRRSRPDITGSACPPDVPGVEIDSVTGHRSQRIQPLHISVTRPAYWDDGTAEVIAQWRWLHFIEHYECMVPADRAAGSSGCRPEGTRTDPRLYEGEWLGEELTSAALQMMTEVVGHFSARAGEGQMLCLSSLHGRGTTRHAPSELVEATEARWANVTTDGCPRTYARPFGLGEEPPPGHVEPQHLSVGRPLISRTGRSQQLLVRRSQGTGGTLYMCYRPVAPDIGAIRCRLQHSWIS